MTENAAILTVITCRRETSNVDSRVILGQNFLVNAEDLESGMCAAMLILSMNCSQYLEAVFIDDFSFNERFPTGALSVETIFGEVCFIETFKTHYINYYVF